MIFEGKSACKIRNSASGRADLSGLLKRISDLLNGSVRKNYIRRLTDARDCSPGGRRGQGVVRVRPLGKIKKNLKKHTELIYHSFMYHIL